MNLYQNPKFYAFLCLLILGLQFVCLHFPGDRKELDRKTGFRLDLLFCACAAVAVGTLLHLYPGNHLFPTGDSAAFIYIGKQMMAGKVPYRDYFDHKGPLLYLIQYAGLTMGGGSTDGLWCAEVINMAVTLLVLQKLCSLASEKRSSVWLALLITFIACGWRIYEGGNFTEEFALPWISAALLVFFRFFRTGAYRKRDIFLLGIAFSAVFLLRANMIAVWVACMPLVLLRFLKEKRFRDLWICTGLFFAGILAAFLPVLFYLICNHALQPFVDCYFTFNMRYTGDEGMDAAMLLHLGKVFSLMILPGLISLVISLAVRWKDSLRLVNLWCFFISFLMLEMSGRDYPHYLIILLPILAFGFTDMFDWTASLFRKNAVREPDGAILLFICMAILAGSIGYHALTGRKTWPEDAPVTWLKENSDKEDDVLILGNYVWPYLAADRATENRFFYQTPPIEISDKIFGEFLKELREHPSDLILDPAGSSDQAEGWRKEVYEQLIQDGYSCRQMDKFSVFFRS